MPYGLYVYTDDAGTNWSVSVPTDMATALGMIAASGQPYLDNTIFPRWANFTSSTNITRQAVIKNLTQFGSVLGSTVTLAGITYTCKSTQGQSVAALQPPLIQPPQALMGPPGPAGSSGITSNYQVLSSDALLHNGDNHSIMSFTTPTPGTYIVAATLCLQLGASATGTIAAYYTTTTGGANRLAAGVNGVVGTTFPWTIMGIATVLTGDSIFLNIANFSGDDVTVRSSVFAGIDASNFMALRIG